MKKRILSIILFLVVSLGVEAVTRKELTQEVLSKIGIKQEIIDETIKLDEKFAGKSIFNIDEDELDARIKMMEEILEKDDRNFDLNDELFTIYILSEKKDYEKAKYYLEKSDKYNDKFSSYFNNIVYNRKVGKKKEAEKIYNNLQEEKIDVMLDDRDEKPGFKFKDADLIGFPFKVVVGKRADEGIVELKIRRTGETLEVSENEVIAKIKELMKIY